MNKIWTLLLLMACSVPASQDLTTFDLQGHRGARGLLPENTVSGLIKAIDLGVTTLEMDLAVTKDSQLVLSHEPFMSAMICQDSSGSAYGDSIEHTFNIYEMTYKQVRAFDCGSLPHPWFPEQKQLSSSKPLLLDVFDTVSQYLELNNLEPVYYNIEIKSQRETDTVFHPGPEDFSDLVYQTISRKMNWDFITIQSFDFRVLQYFKKTYPNVKLALLIENKLPIQRNLDSLDFTPDIYSCEHVLLSREKVKELQNLGAQVIPWTVNETSEMEKLLDWGVDGLITDYPNRFKELLK